MNRRAGRNVSLLIDTVNTRGSQRSALRPDDGVFLAVTSLANTPGLSKIFQYWATLPEILVYAGRMNFLINDDGIVLGL